MILWREARVVAFRGEWDGVAEFEVQISPGETREPSGGAGSADAEAVLGVGTRVRAIAYPGLVGRPEVGDRVLLNATALARGLGTGGYALIVAVPDRLPADPVPGPGHLVKARYTPLQAMVLGVDEQESPHHDVLVDADDLAGMPVIVADLHSSLPAIVAGLREAAPGCRIGYVMTDGGALPAWFSRTVGGLRAAGLLQVCLTAGQAFGGDLEAVSVHSALLAARHVAGVDVAIVAQGPGNLGTGTRWGFSGVAAGEALNAAAVLGGRPIAALRISGADARERHLGISHHSLTAYGRVALARVDVVVPDLAGLDAGDHPGAAGPGAGWAGLVELDARVDEQVRELVTPTGRHREVRVGLAGLPVALRGLPVRLSTMGRGLDADPAAFLAAAAAGRHAASLLLAPSNPA